MTHEKVLIMAFYRSHVLVSVDPECLAKGAHEVIDALNDELIAQGLLDEVQVLETSRMATLTGSARICSFTRKIFTTPI
jgi:hypothetical protein